MSDQQKILTIAIIGMPNAGKSTLLNRILGEKIVPVHRKAQMTRKNTLGVFTEDNTQLVFVDTPGLHDDKGLLNQNIMKDISEALSGADLVAVLLSVTEKISEKMDAFLQEHASDKNVIIIFNKMDAAPNSWKFNPQELVERFSCPHFPVSALKGSGLDALLTEFKKRAEPGEFIFDPDVLTNKNLRDIAADFIREKMMEYVHEELPYQCAIIIEKFDEKPKNTTIKACVVVNRESQKAMVIGKGGENIARIRRAAIQDLKRLLDVPVRLSLFVKVDPSWVEKQDKIERYVNLGH